MLLAVYAMWAVCLRSNIGRLKCIRCCPHQTDQCQHQNRPDNLAEDALGTEVEAKDLVAVHNRGEVRALALRINYITAS